MSAERCFFDTNLLVYLFDAKEPAKQAVAKQLWKGVCCDATPLISTQVLQEFFVTVTRSVKQGLPVPQARQAMMGFTKVAEVVTVTVAMVEAATQRVEASKFSFWDSLIIESALACGAQRLYTEDLQSGQVIGQLEIMNPFTTVG